MSDLRLIQADARSLPLEDESVQCIVTSPPYWGLRKYSGEQALVWGARPDCEHEWSSGPKKHGHPDRSSGGKDGNGSGVFVDDVPRGSQGAKSARGESLVLGGTCRKCGAWRGGFGLEPTIELYVEHTVEILRECRRVLRKDGVLWWNLGDSYCSQPKGNNNGWDKSGLTSRKDGSRAIEEAQKASIDKPGWPPTGVLKPKDLCLIPQRVAIAAQADGWWVRSMVVWSKPNTMPESCSDRPTTSHEYILLLTKSGESQFWTHRDFPGVRTKPEPDYRWFDKRTNKETASEPSEWRTAKLEDGSKRWRRFNLWEGHDYFWDAEAVRELGEGYGRGTGSGAFRSAKYTNNRAADDALAKAAPKSGAHGHSFEGGRNMRSVWEFPTQPYSGAHFATFPEELPRRCIKAGTSEKGACPKCGAPWQRVVEKKAATMNIRGRDAKRGVATAEEGYKATEEEKDNYGKEEMGNTRTVGWKPGCECKAADAVPCVVLDPFGGSGTVGKVAVELGRQAVLCDIAYHEGEGEGGSYLPLARERTSNVQRPLGLEAQI